MKVLILNGSPNKNGTVANLLGAISQQIDPGHQKDWIEVYDLEMEACQGCMKCRTTKKCCLKKDDAHVTGERISEADILIIGTPTHWGNMSSQLKLLFDRNVPVFMDKNGKGLPVPKQKGKKAIIVAACNAPFPFNVLSAESRGAIRSVKHVMKYGGYKVVKTITQAGTNVNSSISPKVKVLAHLAGKSL